MMGYIILTVRSMSWMLLTLMATLMIYSALLNPSWLTAKPQMATFENETISYTPSVGVYAKCIKPISLNHPSCTFIGIDGLATDSEIYPTVWKAATLFLYFGLFIMSITVVTSIISCCFQSIFRKSIFTLSGVAQGVAGISFIVCVMLYPMAWGTTRVQKLCGRDASPFYINDCSIGNGLYVAVFGTLLTFACACLSLPAEKSTSSDKVQDEIFKGRRFICLK
ncbi:unnamed protein product [Brassicogethes aeneus]|uniref:Lipoma HMGIC fusion partner-like 2 protein n=1 Tax=Brassicogethes aeneus TaxID=1431903 RepID=A0A9P0FE00_BRAAE|nr:unnamed protein product [Brassicogethes aeneus]